MIDLGLCISVFDVLEAGDPYVHQGETAAVVKVKFRLIIFRPFVGEILEGKVRSSSEEGIHITLGFFDDILVPASCMQPDTLLYSSSNICRSTTLNFCVATLQSRFGLGTMKETKCSSTLARPSG